MSRYNNNDGITAVVYGITILSVIIYSVYLIITSNIDDIFDVIQNVWYWVTIIIVSILVSSVMIYKYRRIIKNKDNKLTETIRNKDFEINNRESKILSLEFDITNLKECINSKDNFYNSISTLSDISVKYLTELVSDFKLIQYDISAQYLRIKDHPAYVEAKRISELKQETKLYHEQYKQMLYKYEVLIGLFPELTTYIEDFDSIKQLNDFRNLDNLQNDYDRVRDYISSEEYSRLSVDERNQRALNCYINRKNKSRWQIGRDYEMYIAYLYRSKGWGVIQYGIEKKLEDMGRDLIVIGKEKILIVQCKYWSETKLIHEKHIAQLYGSTIEYA